jgi:predicted HTH domain antitoxin
MSTTTITFALPEDIVQNLSFDQVALLGLAREALLVRLYDLGEVSSGRAAEILGISRRAFLDLLGQYGVSVFAAEHDLEADVRHARAVATDYLKHKSTH